MFDAMSWEGATTDQIEEALDHFTSLSSAGLAKVCELIAEVDQRQSWMVDGATNLTDWVSAKLRVRHPAARQLVSVVRRLTDLPVLRSRFASGMLTIDQVDALSRMATPENESRLIDDALGLTNAALDQIARKTRGISEDEAKGVWERRKLVRQWNLDESAQVQRPSSGSRGASARPMRSRRDSQTCRPTPRPGCSILSRLVPPTPWSNWQPLRGAATRLQPRRWCSPTSRRSPHEIEGAPISTTRLRSPAQPLSV